MDRVRYLSLPDPGHLELLLSQHRQIVAALEAGQSDEAGRAMAEHLQEVLRTAQKLGEHTTHLIK
jgi:DNA-binding FadR family transcriptional regulator